MKVKEATSKRGKIYLFEETGNCCWKSGSREFRVTLFPAKYTMKVRLLEATDRGRSPKDCFDDHVSGFTRECLDWIWQNVLDSKKGFYSSIDVTSTKRDKKTLKVLDQWSWDIGDKLQKECSDKLPLKEEVTLEDRDQAYKKRREDLKKGAVGPIDPQIFLLRMCGYEVPFICEGDDPTKFYWLMPDGRQRMNSHHELDYY